MTPAAPAPAAEHLSASLTRQDRCDRCSAQAFVRATLTGGLTLLFCGHHYRGNQDALAASGAHIHDERHRIDEQARRPEA